MRAKTSVPFSQNATKPLAVLKKNTLSLLVPNDDRKKANVPVDRTDMMVLVLTTTDTMMIKKAMALLRSMLLLRFEWEPAVDLVEAV